MIRNRLRVRHESKPLRQHQRPKATQERTKDQRKKTNKMNLILAGVLAHLLAVISPGPDFVVALRNSLQYSRKTGVWTALGFALGVMVHVSYCVAGIALVIAQSPTLFNIIKIGGGLYLIYMGIQSFRASQQRFSFDEANCEDVPWYVGLRSGFVTNVLNPKATLFFLSIFTVLLKPSTPFWMTFTTGAIMVVNTFLWFVVVAYLFTQKKVRDAYLRKQGLIHKVLGGILVVLGVLVIM